MAGVASGETKLTGRSLGPSGCSPLTESPGESQYERSGALKTKESNAKNTNALVFVHITVPATKGTSLRLSL